MSSCICSKVLPHLVYAGAFCVIHHFSYAVGGPFLRYFCGCWNTLRALVNSKMHSQAVRNLFFASVGAENSSQRSCSLPDVRALPLWTIKRCFISLKPRHVSVWSAYLAFAAESKILTRSHCLLSRTRAARYLGCTLGRVV